MKKRILLLLLLWQPAETVCAQSAEDARRLAAALLGPSPMIDDLLELTDQIGGRPTGSEANRRAVEWGVAKFREADVQVHVESFQMPMLWLGRPATAEISGDASFSAAVASMPYSANTPPGGLTAPLLDAGFGGEEDLTRLGASALGAFLLVETHPLLDIAGLFREYVEAAATEKRAFAAGAAGVVYMASRPRNLLYRHNASLGPDNAHPMMVMEREAAKRALRLLRRGKNLKLTARLDDVRGGPYQAQNVIAEIRGSDRPEEVVVLGAHLDAWDLGTGANDNGCNIALVIDVARQMKRLGLTPRRTIRFALWNGEEQGLYGSRAYTERHEEAMDRHVLAVSIDIGSGRLQGFFTNSQPELLPALERALAPLDGLGPFEHVDVPVSGTDHFDFLLHGVATLVGNHEPASYGPDYHAQSDTFDKVDQRQLRINAAVVAAVIYAFAEMEVAWKRRSRQELDDIFERHNFEAELRAFGIWDDWRTGKRGRK